MDKLNGILKSTWGSEQWIAEGWDKISDNERLIITKRIDNMFKDGLPFEIKHDKILYIYAFSMLAQLEVLAIQVPLKFESKLSNPELQKQLRTQLLDEIFHGIVFTKIVYMLSSPYEMPPKYNESIESLCDFIRNEECPKMALMLLNLVAEGWIEEIFNCMQTQGIAPKVFESIVADEHRHVSEADMYQDIGIPDPKTAQTKLAYIEKQLLTNVLFKYKYITSLSILLGNKGATELLTKLDSKHRQQLKKINLKPSDNWNMLMKMGNDLFPQFLSFSQSEKPIPMSPIRKVLMTQWSNPSDPTMVGDFNLNVSCLDFFNKAYPSETLTTLMMQTISLGLSKNESFRTHLSHHELYTSDDSYVGLVVKLPDCGDHIGAIIFKNCHQISTQQLTDNIRKSIRMMAFCYKKREQLEKANPHLLNIMDQTVMEIANDIYPYPMPGNSVVSLSNIGYRGYTGAKSPLRVNEAMKFTLLEIERKMVWNKKTKTFEEQDILPVSISADHRIFDGNLPIPEITKQCFTQVFEQMLKSKPTSEKTSSFQKDAQIVNAMEQLLSTNIEVGYKLLYLMQTLWVDFVDLDDALVSKKVNLIAAATKRFIGKFAKETV